MKVATFNANSIRARLDTVTDWLRKHRPDVLCVQETKVQDDAFPAQACADAGYHVTFRGQKSYNGVALLSKAEPKEVAFGLDDGGPPDEARVLRARVGPLTIVNTYVPQGREINHEMYRYKLEWFGRLKTYFDRHFTPRRRLVWLGDLNVAPEPIDVHNPDEQKDHVCFHVDVRKAFADTRSWGFVDVVRARHPEPGFYTFFDYRAPNAARRKRGWRIDHILATRGLARKCVGAEVDLKPRLAARPSDHTFLAAEFDV